VKTLKIVQGLRKGQHIVNFIDYFSQQELSDIYYVDDKTFDKVWKEYIKIYERSIRTKTKKEA
jgi:hypothetical protein